MKINFFFALSLVLFAAYSTFWTSFVAAKGGEEIGNRLMLECILHTMQVILSVVLLTY